MSHLHPSFGLPRHSGSNRGRNFDLIAASGTPIPRTLASHFADIVNVKGFGAVGNGIADDTAALQAAMNAAGGKTLLIPATGAKYLTGPLTPVSNCRIILEPGVVIEAITALMGPFDRLINLTNNDIHIIGYGATVQMVKPDFTGEQNHGVHFTGCKRVLVEGLASNDCGGDGFTVGQGPGTEDVVLRDCRADNNRRQGLSVTQCKRFRDYNGLYTNTTGTAPSAGVDVEPDAPTEVLEDIRFYDTTCEGNDGAGFLCFLANWNASANYADIQYHRCRSRNNGSGTGPILSAGFEFRRITSTTPCDGVVRYVDCVSEDDQRAGFRVLDKDKDGPLVELVRPVVINANQSADAAEEIGSSIVLHNTGSFTTDPGHVRIRDPWIIDDDANTISTISITSPPGQGHTNVKISNPEIRGTPLTWSIDADQREIRIDTDEDFYVNLPSGATLTDGRHIGRVLTNNGAGTTAVFTLPEATTDRIGWKFTFELFEDFQVRIDPVDAVDQIKPVGTAGGFYIASSVRGSRVSLEVVEDGFWHMVEETGTWTSQP